MDIERTVRLMNDFLDLTDFLTRAEAARLARVSTKTIDRWIKAGLPVVRPGGRRVLIRPADLRAWFRRGIQAA